MRRASDPKTNTEFPESGGTRSTLTDINVGRMGDG
jgi:hypothetical protein